MENLFIQGECDISALGIVSVLCICIMKAMILVIDQKLNFIDGVKCPQMFFTCSFNFPLNPYKNLKRQRVWGWKRIKAQILLVTSVCSVASLLLEANTEMVNEAIEFPCIQHICEHEI